MFQNQDMEGQYTVMAVKKESGCSIMLSDVVQTDIYSKPVAIAGTNFEIGFGLPAHLSGTA